MRAKVTMGLAAGVLAAGLALAQKPPPLGAPDVPGAKPGPAPQPAPQPGKPPVTGEAPRPGAPRAEAPPPIPANEPETVARLRRLLGPDATLAYASAEVTDPARGAVRLAGVTITANGKPTRIESLVIGDLRDDGLGEAEARNLVAEDPQGRVTIAQLNLVGLRVTAPPPGQGRRPDLAQLDSLRLAGVAFQDRDSRVRLASAAIEDYGAGRQTRIGFQGLEVGLPRNAQLDLVRVQRAELRGLDLARVTTEMQAGRATTWHGRYTFELEQVAVLKGNRPLGSLASLRSSADQPENAPGTGSMAMRGLRLEPQPGLDSWFQRLGYDALSFDLTAEGRYDPARNRLEMPTLSLVGQRIGTLALSLVLDNYTQEAAQRGDYGAIRIAALGIRLIDQGLFPRLAADQARATNTPERDLREQWANQAGGLLAAAPLAPLREAAQRFLRGQARELDLAARPPEPLTVQQMQGLAGLDPAQQVQRLGLTAQAR